MLYTGDEMGYMIKWDVSRVIEKLDSQKRKDSAEEGQAEGGKTVQRSTYITEPAESQA
jgi:hypothetical protein